MENGRKYIWRRSAERLGLPLLCMWGGDEDGWREGILEGLSASGCFVVAEVEGLDDRPVHIRFLSPSGRWLTFCGQVVYHIHKRGFALEFSGLSPTERQIIELVVDYYLGQQRSLPTPR